MCELVEAKVVALVFEHIHSREMKVASKRRVEAWHVWHEQHLLRRTCRLFMARTALLEVRVQYSPVAVVSEDVGAGNDVGVVRSSVDRSP